MSLLTRLLGFGLRLLGGFMIGYVQGLQSIVDAINNMIYEAAGSIPTLVRSFAIPLSLLGEGIGERVRSLARECI